MTQENHIFLLSVPEFDELLYFVGKIKSEVLSNQLMTSNYSAQICTTRLMILKNDQIAAAPVFARFSEIHIVASKNYTQDGQLFNYVRSFDLLLQGPHQLTPKIYNDCISYTLTTKLSPEWNKLDKYLIKSSNFLVSSQVFEGITFDTCISDRQFAVTARAFRLKLPLTRAEDLGVDMKLLNSRGWASVDRQIYLLPRLMPGKIVNVSRDLPDLCPFRDYGDIRLYWRNMYGYHLPPYSHDTLYAQVLLNRSGVSYSYPLCCTRLNKIIQLKHERSERLVNDFVGSVINKCQLICGKNIDIKFLKGSICSFRPAIITSEPMYELLERIQYGQNRNPENSNINKINKEVKENYNPKAGSKPKDAKIRSTSPPLFFPKTEVRLVPHQPKKTENTKYFPIFTPKTKNSGFVCLRVPSPNDNNEPLVPRKSEVSKESEPETKKQKFDYNIETLAYSKTLQKATVPQLTRFCKDNSIRVKSKEKKEVLLSKIYNYFGLSVSDSLQNTNY